MRVASFFFGIGGFDQAAKEMGWTTELICEWNEYGQTIAEEHYKEATIYGDIRTTDFSKWRGKIDILCGGFPCQPFSTAGLQLGTEDEHHLWPEMLRGIREIQPPWVVGENVRGLVSWNGGLVFEQVQADLEAEGYEVLPFILPAAGVNAPHRRHRVFFVAHAESKRGERLSVRTEKKYPITGITGVTSNSERFGLSIGNAEQNRRTAQSVYKRLHSQTSWQNFQLNPRFVLEMMGFPPNYCDSAYEKIAWDIYQKKKSTKSFQKRIQNGEKKRLKQQATR